MAFQILNSQNDHKENLSTLASYDFNIVPYVEADTYGDVKKYHDDWLDSKFFEHFFTNRRNSCKSK